MKPSVCRLVNYVLLDGQVRPFLIVAVVENQDHPGMVNGQLFRDGLNDDKLDGGRGQLSMWKPSVYYDELKRPGTWHWPETT